MPMPAMTTSLISAVPHIQDAAVARVGAVVDLGSPGDVILRGGRLVLPLLDAFCYQDVEGIRARA